MLNKMSKIIPVAVILMLCLLAPALADQANPLQYNPDDTPPMEQMIGSMLMLGFRGTSLAPGDPFLQAISDGKIGNVIQIGRAHV